MANVTFSTVALYSTFKSYTGTGKTKASNPLKDGGLYFIEDMGIIMRVSVTDDVSDNTKVDVTYKEYSGKVQTVTGNWPDADASNVIPGVLYVKSGEGGRVSNGTNWLNVYPAASTPATTVTAGESNSVSGAAVYTFVTSTQSLAAPSSSSASASDAGKLVKLNGSGQIDTKFLDAISATTGSTSTDQDKLVKLNSSGKIASDFLPAVALSEFKGKITTSKSDLDALDAENGDWAVLELATDTNNENGTYIYFDDGDSTNTDTPRWIPMADVSSAALTAQLNAKVNTSDVQSSVVSNGTNPVNGTAVANYVGTEISTALTWGTVSAS